MLLILAAIVIVKMRLGGLISYTRKGKTGGCGFVTAGVPCSWVLPPSKSGDKDWHGSLKFESVHFQALLSPGQ
jgi:hypothetical protein